MANPTILMYDPESQAHYRVELNTLPDGNYAIATSPAKGSKTLSATSAGTTATSVLAANAARKAAVLTNPSTSVTVYLGPSTVTTSLYMVALAPGQSYVDQDSSDAWYAVVAAGTQAVNVTEVA